MIGPAYDDDAQFVETAPTLMIRNGGDYDYYYYLSDGALDKDGNFVPGWADAGGNPLGDDGVEIPTGTAFWFLEPTQASATICIPGAVLGDNSSTTDFSTGYTLGGAPYPRAYSFADITFTGIVGPAYDDDAEFVETAPTMLIREGSDYAYYYYLSDGAQDGDGNFIPGWADAGGNPLSDYEQKVLEAGGAFWVYIPATASAFSATFTL